ncbi:MAG TPA: DUF1549 and DUF1553 domain-containing protein [Verrucomicrobiales bacterium]|nr:DUF1549 and DUF1553 domain-containing protein [Verrucomicrobiales bacterium]
MNRGRISGECGPLAARLFALWIALPAWQAGRSEAAPGAENHWAYSPLQASISGPGSIDPGATGPVDALHRKALSRRGLHPALSATPRQRVRRLHAALLGLPPDYETVREFEQDPSPQAWERMVDRLLASPRFGERWGRHWLDLARYADTNGYERDGEKPFAWRYRDYVIGAWNSGLPYDRFIREQLAGDVLQDANADSVVATGFYRLHVWDDEPDDPVRADHDERDDILSTLGAAFLGSTIGCARCHEHKFDPVSQEEYYAFAALLVDVQPYGLPHRGGGSRSMAAVLRDLAPEEQIRSWEEDRQGRLAGFRASFEAAPEEGRAFLELQLRETEAEAPPWPRALAVTLKDGPPPEARVLRRGDPHSPGDRVRPGFPRAFGPEADGSAQAAFDAAVSPRLRLANWVASDLNPLTARVMVNRLWQHLFGEGLVPTPDDFGAAGLPPENPALVDYLASRLIEQEWGLKAILREILLSDAYGMRSDVAGAEADGRDPANRLFWRQNPRRLEGEAVRDYLLFFSGRLSLEMGGPGFFPELPEEFHRTQDTAGKGWGSSEPSQRNRRAVYAYVKRALPAPFLDAFDAGVRSFAVGQRPVSTVAPQALMLLNDALVVECAGALAARLTAEAGPEEGARIDRAFALVLQRSPQTFERDAARILIDTPKERAEAEGLPDAEHRALAGFCQAMFNLNETLYLD